MMSTRIWSAACAAIALGMTAAVLAQDPAGPQPAQSKSTAVKTLTVSGCVQKTQPSPTGTTGARATTPGAPEIKFVLTNAALSPAAGTAGTAGTSGTAAPPATEIASEYRLDTDESRLSSHVGHKVEITG